MWHQCWIFANSLLKFYVTEVQSACKSSVWKGVLFLCLPPPQLHLFWGEARKTQRSRHRSTLVLQWEQGFLPGRRCGLVPGARWICCAQHWFCRVQQRLKERTILLKYHLVPQNPTWRWERGVEQGAFHPQNRNFKEHGHVKQEYLRGWEVALREN